MRSVCDGSVPVRFEHAMYVSPEERASCSDFEIL